MLRGQRMVQLSWYGTPRISYGSNSDANSSYTVEIHESAIWVVGVNSKYGSILYTTRDWVTRRELNGQLPFLFSLP